MTDLQAANAASILAIGLWALYRLAKTSACGEWATKVATLGLFTACVFWLFDRLLLDNQWRVDTLLVHALVAICLWIGPLIHRGYERRERSRAAAARRDTRTIA